MLCLFDFQRWDKLTRYFASPRGQRRRARRPEVRGRGPEGRQAKPGGAFCLYIYIYIYIYIHTHTNNQINQMEFLVSKRVNAAGGRTWRTAAPRAAEAGLRI